MYKIISTDGDVLGITETVRYIKINPSGSLVAANAEDAQGIVYKCTPYNLDDNNIGANTTVFLMYIDAGDIIFKLEKAISELMGSKSENNTAISQDK